MLSRDSALPTFMLFLHAICGMISHFPKSEGFRYEAIGKQIRFNCGVNVTYQCGPPIPNEISCPILRNDPDKVEQGSEDLCKMIEFFIQYEDVVNLFDSKCPLEKENITSYIHYDANGQGLKCSPELGCLDCWDERAVSSGGGIKKEEFSFENVSDPFHISSRAKENVSSAKRSQSQAVTFRNSDTNRMEDELHMIDENDPKSIISSGILPFEISDWPFYISSDFPSYIPSDVPSTIPSDLPSRMPSPLSELHIAREPSLSSNPKSAISEKKDQTDKTLTSKIKTNNGLPPESSTSNLSLSNDNVELSQNDNDIKYLNGSSPSNSKNTSNLNNDQKLESLDETHTINNIATIDRNSIVQKLPQSTKVNLRHPIQYVNATYQIPAIGINAVGLAVPEFATYSGFRYKYTGQCDLVLLHSENFGNGIGLTIHLRTRISSSGTQVIAIFAFKIGDDIIQISHLDAFSWNRLSSSDKTASSTIQPYEGTFPITLNGGSYSVFREVQNILPMNHITAVYTIKLNNETQGTDAQYIRLTPLENTLSIEFAVNIDDSTGMLGSSHNDTQRGVLGRDGKTLLSDVSEIALEWQVKENDINMFSKSQYPQYPRLCFGLPSSKVESTDEASK